MSELKKYGKKILLSIIIALLCVSSAISITLLGKTKTTGTVFANEPEQKNAVIYKTTGLTASNTENLSTEVALTRGGAELEDGGIVYEGEYIKYNFRLTNKTQANIDNVKLVASIPEGVKYGELKCNFNEIRQPYFYDFNEELTEKTIEVGTIEAGKSKEVFYEVKVKDLLEGEEEKSITANVSSYVGESVAQSYELKNVVKPADVQLFLGSFTQYGGKQYGLNIKSDTQEEVEVKIHFPQNFELDFITYMTDKFEDIDKIESQVGGGEIVHLNVDEEDKPVYTLVELEKMTGQEEFSKLSEEAKAQLLEQMNKSSTLEGLIISEDNVLTAKLKANHCYKFMGKLDSTKIEVKPDKIIEDVTAYAETAESGYMSNENIIKVPLQDVEVSMTSSKEGQKVKYEEDIDYVITIKNIGEAPAENNVDVPSCIVVDVLDFIPENINPKSITYNNWRIVAKEKIEDPRDQQYYLKEEREITESISGKVADDEGNAVANINSQFVIPKGETVIIKIEATAGFVYEETEVENMVIVKSDEMAQERISNKVSHTILPYNYENSSVPDVPDVPTDPSEPSIPDIPNNPNDPNRPSIPDTPNVPDNPNRGDNPNDSKEPTREKICNFKIDKYISKVTVKTASGVKEYQYENEKLAKVEIKAKEINGATVTVDYKIVVTNEGDVAGIVSKISDSLPAGFAITNVSNKSWPRDARGEYINTSKSNLRIDPGESTTLTISATKQMTSETVGTYKNQATIKSAKSISGTQDSNSQDDVSSAEIIISISTGIYVYIAIIISILAILSLITVYLVKKGKLKIGKSAKAVFIAMLFIVMLSTNTSQVLALNFAVADGSGKAPGEDFMATDINNDNLTWTNSNGQIARCKDSGIISQDGWFVPSGKPWKTPPEKYKPSKRIQVTVGKVNAQVEMKSVGDSFQYGPFNYVASGKNVTFKCIVEDHNKNPINATISGNLNVGSNSFYLIIPKSSCKNGISRVRLEAQGEMEIIHYKRSLTLQHYIGCEYGEVHVDEYGREWRDVLKKQPIDCCIDEEPFEEHKYFTQSDFTEWTDINGTLEIEKVDADNYDKKLSGVTFEISGLGQHTTDANGRIYLENIRPGTYSIREVSNTNYGYLATSSDIINIDTVSDNIGVRTGQYRTPIEKNIKLTGNLVIEKTSKESGKPLEDFSFKLRDSKGRYIIAKTGENKTKRDKVKEYILLTDMETTTDINQATEFITDSKGHIEIYNLLIDTYEIIEVSVGADKREENRYFEVDDNYITWSSNVNNNGWTTNVSNNGTRNIAKVKVTRQKSQDTEKIGGPADKISIKNERKYIDIKGLVWEDMVDGKKSIRNNIYKTPTEGTEDRNDKLLGNVTVNLKSIDENGNVKLVEKIKANTKDGVKDVNGTIDTGVEGSGDEYYGKYEFRNVLIRDLDKYYIEFVYNGLSYQAIDLAEGTYKDLKNGYLAEETKNTSKAIEQNTWQTKFEENSRTVFNDNYKVITRDNANGDAGDLSLKYDFANRVSTLNFEGNPKYGYSGARFPINYTKDQYLMLSENEPKGKETTNTRKAYNGGLDQIKSKQEIREKDIKVINNVNLGLYEREQPDLGINGKLNTQTNQAEYGKQLDNVKIKINGYNHIYKYESRFLNAGDYQEGFNVGVKFENRRGAQPYTRAIYKADVEFESADKSRELEVYLTYKIILNNNSANLKAQINEIVDYYDSRYIKEEIKVGTKLSDVADPTNPDPNKEIKITEFGTSANGYNKIVIDTSKLGYIEPQSACKDYVYVQFKLNKQAVVEILCDGDINNIKNGIQAPENKLLKNVVEIKSYSIQDQTGAVYAGIDRNSNPENCKPGDDTTYEDDTDYSPAVKLAVAKNNRTINGLAFEDNATLNNNIRQGSGSYNTSEGDRPLKGVVVQLQRRDYDDMGKWKTIKETGPEGTKADGTFQFEDFAAGDYQLTYKWDNSNDNKHGTSAIHPNILVQNYKATIFDEGAHKLNATTEGNEERAEKYYWYRADNRLSDAKDNYETRKKIDGEISTFRYNTETEVNKSGTNSMTSATPEIPIGVEYADVISTSKYGDEYKYDVTNIDFGIVERPLQNYKLTKNIDHIKITLQNGQVLVDADVIVEPAGKGTDGRMTYSMKLEGVTNFLKPLPRVGSRFVTGKSNEAGYPNGSVEFEVDNEVIQGSTLEITYKINIENTSELDYNNQDFYEHGTNATTNYKKDVIRITPSKVIDYLDKEWAVDESIPTNADTWKKETQEALQAGGNGTDKFPVNPDVYTKEDSELKDRIILYTDKLSKEGISLVPNDPTSRTGTQDNSLKEYGASKEDKRLTLVATKVLTTIDSTDVVLANETEIIEIQRPSGGVPEENIEGKTLIEETGTRDSKLQQREKIIPGNFVPGSGWQVEPDDDKSETFFITPNTGEDLNYIIPISIGIGALIILGIGTILVFVILVKTKKDAE